MPYLRICPTCDREFVRSETVIRSDREIAAPTADDVQCLRCTKHLSAESRDAADSMATMGSIPVPAWVLAGKR